jgi:hypothetical protein
MPETSNRKFGAIPSPRHRLAAAIPHQIIGETPSNFLINPNQLSFWGNDTYNDCVTAEEAFAKACYHNEIFIPYKEAVDWATSHNYQNGAVIYDVMETMNNNGFVFRGGPTS